MKALYTKPLPLYTRNLQIGLIYRVRPFQRSKRVYYGTTDVIHLTDKRFHECFKVIE